MVFCATATAGVIAMMAHAQRRRGVMRTLPNPRNRLRVPHHRITWLAPEGLRERRHVRQWPVRAPLLRRVGVDHDARPEPLVSIMCPPALCVADEEALLGRESLDLVRPSVARQRTLQRVVPYEHAAQIGD